MTTNPRPLVRDACCMKHALLEEHKKASHDYKRLMMVCKEPSIPFQQVNSFMLDCLQVAWAAWVRAECTCQLELSTIGAETFRLGGSWPSQLGPGSPGDVANLEDVEDEEGTSDSI
jgi:hypothetical protein